MYTKVACAGTYSTGTNDRVADLILRLRALGVPTASQSTVHAAYDAHKQYTFTFGLFYDPIKTAYS